MSKPGGLQEDFYYDDVPGRFYHAKLEGTEEQVALARELLKRGKMIEVIIEETGVSVVGPYGTVTRESIQRERERLYEKARHDEAQALYHAKQEGISERNIEIAQTLLRRGRPIDEIVEDTGLTYQEVEHLRTNV